MKKLLLALCILISPNTAVAVAPPAPGVPFTVQGSFFALYVSDLSASTKWYSEKLGMQVVMRTPKQGKAAVVVLEGGGLIVELIQHDDAAPRARAVGAGRDPALIVGMSKAGVVVEDLDRTLALLKERGVQPAFGPFPARAGQRANAIIRDNAGNLIQLFGK